MMNSEPEREKTVKELPEFKGSVKWKPWKETSFVIPIQC
jgi:hypothetical protein